MYTYTYIYMYTYMYIYIYIYVKHLCLKGIISKKSTAGLDYGVATISRLLKIIGLFCRISSLL